MFTLSSWVAMQVDVIYRARREVMQKQLAHCHQILGSLETSKKWTEEFQKHNCIVSLDCNEFEGYKNHHFASYPFVQKLIVSLMV